MTLKEYLDDTGQTQKGFGESVEQSEASISRLVNRTRDPKFRTALRIHQVTNRLVSFEEMAAAS